MKRSILLLDKSKIQANFKNVKDNLKDFRVAYAIKANSHKGIITALKKNTSWFETASIEEILFLIGQGIDPQKILFSNPVKPKSDIEEAWKMGVRIMTFDSLLELEKFKEFPNLKLFLRIQVPNIGSIWPLTGKFGMPEDQWEKAFQILKDLKLQLNGVTFHVGSQCEKLDAWKIAIEKSEFFLERAQLAGLKPDSLNIGGGFPIFLGREIPDILDIGISIRKAVEKLQLKLPQIKNLYAEPGRCIVGSAGFLIAEVIGWSEKQENSLLFLNIGTFNGMTETIDGITYPVLYSNKDKKAEVKRWKLCGPTCDSVDTMYEIVLPQPKLGDQLVFTGAGAYTNVYSSEFNGFAPVKVKMLPKIWSPEALVDFKIVD